MVSPILILDAYPRMVETIVRSPQRRRIPVIAAAVALWEFRLASRPMRRFVVLPDYRESSDAFFRALRRVIETLGTDTLLSQAEAKS